MVEQVHNRAHKTNIEKLKNIKIAILDIINKYSRGTIGSHLCLWNGVRVREDFTEKVEIELSFKD